jgi:hypothetical protein
MTFLAGTGGCSAGDITAIGLGGSGFERLRINTYVVLRMRTIIDSG